MSDLISGIGFEALFQKLNELNPGCLLLTTNLYGDDVIITTTHPSKLVYPTGYYWTAKNGVTNKHNTANGAYECFDVYVMEMAK